MALQTCSPSSSHKTGFMDLPVELRLEVYQHLLHMPAFDKFARHPTAADFVHANVLLANRQINAEATPLLYGDNMFVAHPTMLASFPRLRAQYGPVKESSVVPRIRRFHLQVRLDVDLPYDRDTAARAFSGLDELDVDVVQNMYLGAGHRNLHKLERVRGVKSVRITGSTTGFDDYVQWLQAVMMSPPGTEFEDFKPTQAAWPANLAPAHV